MSEQKASELAAKCLAEVNRLGTKTAAAKSLGISIATVSRYIKLMELSPEALQQVDDGLRPVRSKQRGASAKSTVITSSRLNTLLDILGHSVFATLKQLSQYAKLSESVTRDALYLGMRKRLVTRDEAYKPYAYSLTIKGANAAGVQLPKHFMSDAATHQRLLRNEIELGARKVDPNAFFVSRPALWKRGVYPAFGEWCLQYEDKDNTLQMALILIDDYGMPAARLLKALDRNHSTKKDYLTGKMRRNKVLQKNAPAIKNVSWKKIVKRYSVHSTSKQRVKRFKQYTAINKDRFDVIEPIFRIIDPIWDVSAP